MLFGQNPTERVLTSMAAIMLMLWSTKFYKFSLCISWLTLYLAVAIVFVP